MDTYKKREMSNCPRCGTQVPPPNNFCPTCGTQIFRQPQYQPPAHQPQYASPAPPRKKPTLLIFLFSCIGCVVVIIVGCIIIIPAIQPFNDAMTEAAREIIAIGTLDDDVPFVGYIDATVFGEFIAGNPDTTLMARELDIKSYDQVVDDASNDRFQFLLHLSDSDYRLISHGEQVEVIKRDEDYAEWWQVKYEEEYWWVWGGFIVDSNRENILFK